MSQTNKVLTIQCSQGGHVTLDDETERHIENACGQTLTYAYGTYVQLSAKPDSGYSFQYWTKPDGTILSYNNPLNLVMFNDLTVIANFISTGPPPPPECTEGSIEVLEYCPDGVTWKRRRVCIGGKWQEFIQQCPAETITMTITVTPSGSGTISPYGVGTYTVVKGSTITLTATPASGYRFDYWEGIPGYTTNTSNPVTFIANQNLTINARFSSISPPPTIPQGRLKITNTRTGEFIDSDYHDLQNTTKLSNYYFPPMVQSALKVRPNDVIIIEFWVRDKNTQLPISNVYCEANSGDANGSWGTPITGWPNRSGYNSNGYIVWNVTIPSDLAGGRRFAVYCWCRV